MHTATERETRLRIESTVRTEARAQRLSDDEASRAVRNALIQRDNGQSSAFAIDYGNAIVFRIARERMKREQEAQRQTAQVSA